MCYAFSRKLATSLPSGGHILVRKTAARGTDRSESSSRLVSKFFCLQPVVASLVKPTATQTIHTRSHAEACTLRFHRAMSGRRMPVWVTRWLPRLSSCVVGRRWSSLVTQYDEHTRGLTVRYVSPWTGTQGLTSDPTAAGDAGEPRFFKRSRFSPGSRRVHTRRLPRDIRGTRWRTRGGEAGGGVCRLVGAVLFAASDENGGHPRPTPTAPSLFLPFLAFPFHSFPFLAFPFLSRIAQHRVCRRTHAAVSSSLPLPWPPLVRVAARNRDPGSYSTSTEATTHPGDVVASGTKLPW